MTTFETLATFATLATLAALLVAICVQLRTQNTIFSGIHLTLRMLTETNLQTGRHIAHIAGSVKSEAEVQAAKAYRPDYQAELRAAAATMQDRPVEGYDRQEFLAKMKEMDAQMLKLATGRDPNEIIL